MVAPERQRQGLGEILFGTWDTQRRRLARSRPLRRLVPPVQEAALARTSGPVPCLVKPLTRRALRQPKWSMPVNRLVVGASRYPVVKIVARARAAARRDRAVTRQFDDRFTRSGSAWDRSSPSRCGATRRTSSGSTSRRRTSATRSPSLTRDGRGRGLRRLPPRAGAARQGDAARRLPHRSRTTRAGFDTLVRWVDREARDADSDKIRTFCLARGLPARC